MPHNGIRKWPTQTVTDNRQQIAAKEAEMEEQVIAQAEQAEGGESGAPQAEAPTTEVNWTKSDAFRRYQSERDAEALRLKRELAAVKRNQEQMAEQMAQRAISDLDGLDAEEQVVRLKQLAASQKADYDARLSQIAEEQRQAELWQQIGNSVQAAGLSLDDPRIAAAVRQSQTVDDAAWSVNQAVVSALAEEREKLRKEAEEARRAGDTKAATVAADVRKKATVEALNEAGVTQTSNANGAKLPVDERGEAIKRLGDRFNKLKGTGVGGQPYMNFLDDMRKAGVTFEDLGY